MSDRVRMLMSMPPKYALSRVVGPIKGKSANPSRPLSMVYRVRLRGAAFREGRSPQGSAPEYLHLARIRMAEAPRMAAMTGFGAIGHVTADRAVAEAWPHRLRAPAPRRRRQL